ncbi:MULTISPECIES: rhomboid-like protein [unclassified Mycolicibacterium]|uniref:rhomboid-like protein n=1 Tax=unclassified Mycolicibacterium TaxID=2636767 RepID=UPI001EE402AC|nr:MULTISPECIES: rhomboid-like protein [unclassified Mycolicibacterium]
MKSWLAAVWRFVCSAPLTYAWLTVLLVTTIIQHQTHGRQLHDLLVQNSTNIHHLETDPLYVLATSLFWIDGKYWTPYLVLFSLILAPAERWLGQIRWLTVGLIAHVLATYISEGLLYLAIHDHLAPQRLVHVRDVGVSYFLVGVGAVLAYRIRRPWRWLYLGTSFIYFGAALIININFTAIGHLSALLIGLCCYPLTRHRGGQDRVTDSSRSGLTSEAASTTPPPRRPTSRGRSRGPN